MNDMLKFFIGLWIGGAVGFFACALLSANGRDGDDVQDP